MVSPNSENSDENWINSVYRSRAEWDTSAASSAKSSSRKLIFFTFDFAFRRAGLKRLLSDFVCSLTPKVDEQKARFNSIEKKTPKRVGARTHPCFTPLMVVNDSETLPLYWTVAFLLVWKDFTMLKRLGGQPIFNNIVNIPSLLTRSKVLVRSMKAIYKDMFCCLHFSCSCRTQKIISGVERWDLNLHCDSGYTLLANFCRRGRITRAKVCFASNTKQWNSPQWLLQSIWHPCSYTKL